MPLIANKIMRRVNISLCIIAFIALCIMLSTSAIRMYLEVNTRLDIKNSLMDRHEVAPPPKAKAFVCITGQLARLKLQNKADRLFRHWHEHYGVEIDVALVISNTTFASKPALLEDQGGINQEFFEMSQVVEFFEDLPGINLLNSEFFEPSANPKINQQYYEQRSEGSSHTEGEKKQRVQNHIRQFESIARCHSHMVLSKSYDIVHRVRDDSGYLEPVPFDKILNMTRRSPKTIVSSACQTHGGLNDRGSFVSPDAAFDYFNHPMSHMYNNHRLPTDVSNTERFIMYAYSRTCHLVSTNKFHILRIAGTLQKPESMIMGEFDDEGGGLVECLERGRDHTHYKRPQKCREFSSGEMVCVEVDKED